MSEPPPVRLRALIRARDECGVDFVVFGAAAMAFYGFVRATQDIDIVVKPERENVDRLSDLLVGANAVLALQPARRFGSRERWAPHRGENATLITDLGPLDIVQRLEGMPPWDDLAREAELYEFEGITVRVMNRRAWAHLTLQRGSPQDLADVDTIEHIDEA